VEEAATRGIAAVADAPREIRALFAQIEEVPVWTDWKTIDRGGDLLMRAGPLGGVVLGARSLVIGYASPAGNKPLVLTGRLEHQAARRINETARFVQAVCRARGMRPGAEGWQIAVRVRLIHAQVRRMILKSGSWRADQWGAPINQHDMAGTCLLFSLVVIEGLRSLGLQVDSEEAERYLQLWRFVGHVLGLEPELTPGSMYDATRLAELIAAIQGPPDDDSRALTRALLDSPRTGAKTSADLLNAQRRTRFGEAACRHLVGETLADALAIPRTTWRFSVPILTRLVRGAELLRASVSFPDGPAIAVGSRYWDRVVQVGLAGATAEFVLPDKLAAA
jgi:phage-related protein